MNRNMHRRSFLNQAVWGFAGLGCASRLLGASRRDGRHIGPRVAQVPKGISPAKRNLVQTSMTELFLDDEMIAMAAGVTRRIHQPRKHRLNPIIKPEQWWEGNQMLPYATLYDKEEKLFKMWLRCGSDLKEQHTGGHAAYTTYLTSEDGVHWQRPMLGIMDFAGRRDHNVIFTGDEAISQRPQGKKGTILSVIRHPHPKDETEKYVGLYFIMSRRGAYLAYSADGIRWKREKEPFWVSRLDPAPWGDDQVMELIYDKRKNKWVMYRRVIPEESERMVAQPGDENWQPVEHYHRVFAYADSVDLQRWGNFQIVLAPDGDDPADTDVYQLTCHNYEQVYVGYLNMFHKALDAQNIDVQLVTSRDGTHFTRVCRRELFVPSGPDGYFDYMVMTGYQAEPVIVDDTVYLYYEGVNYNHGVRQKPPYGGSSVGLVTFKRDRFVSLGTTAWGPGRLVTKPLTIQYPKLFLNAVTWGNGEIRVEILTRDWQPIAGFTKADAISICGNALAHPVRWKGHTNLLPVLANEVRLKFYMNDALVHAFSLDKTNRLLGEVTGEDALVVPTGSSPVQI